MTRFLARQYVSHVTTCTSRFIYHYTRFHNLAELLITEQMSAASLLLISRAIVSGGGFSGWVFFVRHICSITRIIFFYDQFYVYFSTLTLVLCKEANVITQVHFRASSKKKTFPG